MSIRIEESGADSPQTVDEARGAVERSRQRISSTLDELEGRIVEKKHEIQQRADVLRPVREQIATRPFTAVAVGVGVGALLGSLGGGDDEYSRRRSGRISGRALSDEDRTELLEWRRARRKRLRAAMRRSRHEHDHDHERDDQHDDDGDSRFDALKHQLMGAVTSAITTALTRRVRRLAADNMNSVVDNVFGGDSGHDRHRGDGRPAGGGATASTGRYAERESYP
jgi:ElaB/YqjD/DUF883 family membrane-anchored ribosome-binding protein